VEAVQVAGKVAARKRLCRVLAQFSVLTAESEMETA
jgi:hypothetical protein